MSLLVGIMVGVIVGMVLLRLSLCSVFPASFAFGDSLLDTGNNNHLVSLARANFDPYGIDFGRPTGRFCNGRTSADVINQQLGLAFSPPYMAPTTAGSAILKGVNYASGAAGILNDSGIIFRLFDLGAKKIVVSNIGPIGCTPYMRDFNPQVGDECDSSPDQLIQLYNTHLKGLLVELKTNLLGSLFVYADVYHIMQDVLLNYNKYGFENVNSSCCLTAGQHGGLIPCAPDSKVCEDRSKYAFWDSFHPSDAMNAIFAERLLNGDIYDVSPMNIYQLSQV
ncbi:hypothetical protein RJT34_14584 [Clitoria ternatea]|uniref:GDSL esterase/lipase n=1 Tax=Clitoria ternatea TaxID=43366 RepID=A0AAN9JSR9_CLITE